jgi:hypothetical protein
MRLFSGMLVGALGLAFAALAASDGATVGLPAASLLHPAWHEVKWPFALDEWGIGRAFRCTPADCGTEVDLYLRAKTGFCNCSTGVSDDDDLDRVGDIALFSDTFAGLAEGRPVGVGRLRGRLRPYHVNIPYAAPRDMLAIGFNDKCDVAVATVLADPDRLTEAGRLALDFLSADQVQRWAAAELGRDGI